MLLLDIIPIEPELPIGPSEFERLQEEYLLDLKECNECNELFLLAIPVVLVVLLVYVFYIRKKRREIMRQ